MIILSLDHEGGQKETRIEVHLPSLALDSLVEALLGLDLQIVP
jgi:hypothetical protein